MLPLALQLLLSGRQEPLLAGEPLRLENRRLLLLHARIAGRHLVEELSPLHGRQLLLAHHLFTSYAVGGL